MVTLILMELTHDNAVAREESYKPPMNVSTHQ